jgi:diaminohydroxyphosphoribosylaminopyrimidine deaminase / 5-amino-6-(5-phosphoribosylamino)uracil reductase
LALQPPATDEHWMRRALAIARRGEGRTCPNPPVGAVVVGAGQVLGEGYHRRAGAAHAEVDALRDLDGKACGATLYVTLEPCSTHGRTPPCTERILACGIGRVVVSVRDPNPAHAGRGLRLLRAAGVDVVEGVCSEAGQALLAPFAKWITTGRPFVTLKMGMTLDGRIADSTGRSRWITGPAARREVRRLRQRADAIVVGRNTAACDDPSLRWSAIASRNPKRIIVDATGAVSPDSQVFQDGQAQNTIVATTRNCPEACAAAYVATGAQVWYCGRGRRVSLRLLMKRIGEAGLLHVLCEGGGELAAQLVRDEYVDAFEFFVAPTLLGGGGAPVIGGKGWPLGHAPALRFTEVKQVGDDVLIRAVPAGAASCITC